MPPDSAKDARGCHFYLAEGCHFYPALTLLKYDNKYYVKFNRLDTQSSNIRLCRCVSRMRM